MLSAGIVALIAVVFLGPFGDLDYTWQILAGKQIIETGRFRVVDEWSYTIAGQTLPDFEWLWEVALYGIWQVSGYTGLKILKLTCAFGPLLIVGHQLRQRGVGWAGILFSQIIAVVVLAPNWNLRPLCCTTIGLLLVSGWLHDHCIGRQQLNWRLPAVMCLWANCHPGVIAGQALLIGAIVWESFNVWIRLHRPLDRASLNRLTFFGGLGLLATFVSSAPIERLLYPFRTRLDDPIWHVFTEMQPAFQFITKAPYTIGLAYILFAMVVVALVLRIRQCRLWELALIAGAGGLANMAVRGLTDWLLLTIAIGVPHVKAIVASNNWQAWRSAVDKWRDFAYSPALIWQWRWPTTAVVALIGLGFIPATAHYIMATDVRENPVAAADWMQANNIHGRIFSPPDYGSYLNWRMPGQTKCYVDTRGFYFPPQLIADAHLLPALADDWPAMLDRVLAAGTDYFLLETTGPRAGLWQVLGSHVAPVFRDQQSVLLSSCQVGEAYAKLSNTGGIAVGSMTQPDLSASKKYAAEKK
jgi:hypothetical protein